jgi:hypothetical protein
MDETNALVVKDKDIIKLGTMTVTTPTLLIEQATVVAKELSKIVSDQKLFSNIKGKNFVRVEGWATMGAMLGILPRERSVVEHENGDFEATVDLIRSSDGAIIGSGSAIVGSDESTWASRPRYARRSMAITRASGKAFRLGFSWIMTLAGYEPTPAEEMDGIVDGHFTEPAAPPPARKPAAQPAQKKAANDGRPWSPEVLREKMQQSLDMKLDKGWEPKDKAEADVDKMRYVVRTNLEALFAGEGAEDKRHTICLWLFGEGSTSKLSPDELVTLKRWINARPDEGGEWKPDPLASQEANAAYEYALKAEGQLTLDKMQEETGL